jgi:hypothetical protein
MHVAIAHHSAAVLAAATADVAHQAGATAAVASDVIRSNARSRWASVMASQAAAPLASAVFPVRGDRPHRFRLGSRGFGSESVKQRERGGGGKGGEVNCKLGAAYSVANITGEWETGRGRGMKSGWDVGDRHLRGPGPGPDHDRDHDLRRGLQRRERGGGGGKGGEVNFKLGAA